MPKWPEAAQPQAFSWAACLTLARGAGARRRLVAGIVAGIGAGISAGASAGIAVALRLIAQSLSGFCCRTAASRPSSSIITMSL